MCWTVEPYIVKYGLKMKIEGTFMFIYKPSYMSREEDEVQVQYDPSRKIYHLIEACNGYMKTELHETLP